MKKVTITIAGTTGSGKSSLAQAIGRHLQFMHGINVSIEDELGESNKWEEEELEDRLERIAEQTEVVIITKMSMRSSPDEQ